MLYDIIFKKGDIMKRLLLAICFAVLFPVLSLAGTVGLKWDANTESDIAGYKVHRGIISEVYTDIVDVGNTTIHNTGTLVDGTNYFFAVTAYDTTGNESGFSNEVSYLIIDNIKPSAPGMLRIIIIIQ